MNINQKEFEDLVDEKLTPTVRLLEGTSDFSMNKHGFLKIVDDVSVCKKLEDFNIVYDNEANKIKVFKNGEWEEYLLMAGIIYIMDVIKDYFIDDYEKYLIKKIETTPNYFKKQCYREHLQECYKFMCCFDIKPSYHDKSNSEIMDTTHGKDVYDIAERCVKEYRFVEKNLTKSQINKVNKDVLNIIKNNSKKTLKDINRKVMELIKVDSGFQQKITM